MSKTQPKPEGLSLLQAIAVGVNTTSPAYSLAAILAPMALLVGYSTPIVLVVSFIPMALTSLAFMYLNRRDPDCGTTFSWVTRALGPKPGFIAGLVIASAGILILGSLAETAITYGFLTFGLNGLADNRTLVVICAALLIVLMTGFAIAGSDSSIRMQTIISFTQVGILLAFGVAAAILAFQDPLPFDNPDWLNPLSKGLDPLIAALLLGVFAFWGWEAATNLSEECRKPSDAGRAGVLSTVILLTTYVLVAITVAIYLGKSGFYPVGDSGLVLVDMSGVAFGPMAFMVLVAVAISALASTQSSMVPGSRAVLSMARRGALPARLGLVHPRFKSPWVSLCLIGGIAAGWYLIISMISENAMLDTLSSLGILVAFYYSLTGISCVIYYRKHVVASVKGFLLVGVGPILGSLGLAFMLVVGVRSVWNPADSASGVPWLGLAPPLAIAAIVAVLVVTIMIWRMIRAPQFFRNNRERANYVQSPFPIGPELPIKPGGVLIDCNADAHEVVAHVNAHAQELRSASPVVMVFGIHPAGVSGEEFEAAREALIDTGYEIFVRTEQALKDIGVRNPIKFFDEGESHASVAYAKEVAQPSLTI